LSAGSPDIKSILDADVAKLSAVTDDFVPETAFTASAEYERALARYNKKVRIYADLFNRASAVVYDIWHNGQTS
jgi:hypothetical protein